MPRIPKTDRPITWKVNMPESIAAEVELHLFDPVRGNVAYGARSKLIEGLLRAWLDAKRAKQSAPSAETSTLDVSQNAGYNSRMDRPNGDT